jgi:hypothetical protein
MGDLIQFPNQPGCPPHEWIPTYGETVPGGDLVLGEGNEEYRVSGRVCVKCSLIEGEEALALFRSAVNRGGGSSGSSGGEGQGFFTGIAKPLLFGLLWFGWSFFSSLADAVVSWCLPAPNTVPLRLLRRQP